MFKMWSTNGCKSVTPAERITGEMERLRDKETERRRISDERWEMSDENVEIWEFENVEIPLLSYFQYF